MKSTMMLLAAALVFLTACGDSEDSHDHESNPAAASGHAEHGPHGGELIELGDHVAHLEVVHDDDSGTITLYSLDADLKPTTLSKAPVLNFVAGSGPKQVTATPKGGSKSEWVFSDPALKGEPEGARLRVVLNGVTYAPDLPHHHEGDDPHAGHDH